MIAQVRRWLSPFVILLIWEIMSRSRLVDPFFLPAPSAIAVAGFHAIIGGELIRHAGISLFRALSGYVLSIIAGIGIGIAVGWSKTVEYVLDPVIELTRPISTLALIPLMILWLGVGNASKIAIVIKACLFPILLNTIAGVKGVEKRLLQAARSLGAGNLQLLLKVVIPASLPMIFTGVRISAAMCMLAIVGVEMLASNSGLGFYVVDMQRVFATDRMFVGIITLTLLGFALDRIMRYVQRRVLAWHAVANQGSEIA
jgi:ABC-type nitrate/sulfonate/bicarbonate transport system permease component